MAGITMWGWCAIGTFFVLIVFNFIWLGLVFKYRRDIRDLETANREQNVLAAQKQRETQAKIPEKTLLAEVKRNVRGLWGATLTTEAVSPEKLFITPDIHNSEEEVEQRLRPFEPLIKRKTYTKSQRLSEEESQHED